MCVGRFLVISEPVKKSLGWRVVDLNYTVTVKGAGLCMYWILVIGFGAVAIALALLVRQRRSVLKWSVKNLTFWPPRIKTTIIHNTSAISFSHFATELHGRLEFVRRADEGDSHNVVLTFEPHSRQISDVELEKMRVRVREKTPDETFVVADVPLIPQTSSLIERVRVDDLNHDLLVGSLPSQTTVFLEVECLAAGVEVKGDNKQRQSLMISNLRYSWNVFFKSSGHHHILFGFRVIQAQDGRDDVHELGTIDHEVHVGRFIGLTSRQILNIAWVSGGLAGLFTIVKILNDLGIIGSGAKKP